MLTLKASRSRVMADFGSEGRLGVQVNGKSGSILAGAGLLAAMALAYLGARYWSDAGLDYHRLSPDPACELRDGPCRLPVEGGFVALGIEPVEIPLMRPLNLNVEVSGVDVDDVVVEIRGLNMEMGQNRTRLDVADGDRWEGETILPICSQRRMEWEAVVRVTGAERLELPFLFHTTRP